MIVSTDKFMKALSVANVKYVEVCNLHVHHHKRSIPTELEIYDEIEEYGFDAISDILAPPKPVKSKVEFGLKFLSHEKDSLEVERAIGG